MLWKVARVSSSSVKGIQISSGVDLDAEGYRSATSSGLRQACTKNHMALSLLIYVCINYSNVVAQHKAGLLMTILIQHVSVVSNVGLIDN